MKMAIMKISMAENGVSGVGGFFFCLSLSPIFFSGIAAQKAQWQQRRWLA